MTTANDAGSHKLREAHDAAAADRLADAEDHYRQVIATDPGCAPAYHGLAMLAYRVERLDLAADLLASAIALDVQNASYHRDRAEVCRRLGRLDDAVAEGHAAVQLAPDDAEAYYNLGLAYADRSDYATAVGHYRRAIELNPSHGWAFNNLGSALQRLHDAAGAEAAFRAALSINDRHVEANNNLGSLLSQVGDFDAARHYFEAALAAAPRSIVSHFNRGALRRYAPDDPACATLESLARDAGQLPRDERIKLCFALGKMRDDIGRYDEAFAAYQEGNRSQASAKPYNEANAARYIAEIVRVFDRSLLERHPHAGNPDPTPVFIVGMPRSGTSLIEQILASHPAVFGAGELKDFHTVVLETPGISAGMPFAQATSALPSEALTDIGNRYLARIRTLAPEATRITDKMPGNFSYLGLIRLALPNAKIIHSMRDPLDSCLSCYTHLFDDTMEFAYDIGTLGRYYVRYMTLMRHWHAILPGDFILDVRYEDVVDDIETQARRMLDHIGLAWDDRCLEFHRTQRRVQTASLVQVRQPIYKGSVSGWRRFEKQLAPLMEIVKDHR